MSISPSDSDLADAARKIRSDHPEMGAAKMLPLVLEEYPGWAVSEKRLRKTLQREGLSVGSRPVIVDAETGLPYPESGIVSGLDPARWTSRVKVNDFGRRKGKGLVASVQIIEGEQIWLEDPVVLAPGSELDDMQRGAQACLYCSKVIKSGSFPVSCECSGVFCNRLCATRGAAHAFLCPVQNPASIPFVTLTRAEQWKAPNAWARVAALLFTYASRKSEGREQLDQTLAFIRGLAGLSLDKRVQVLPNWKAREATSTELWRKTHSLFVQALISPPDPTHAKKLAQLKGKQTNELSQSVLDELFGSEAFLLGLGKMSLNLEAHGGLYMLHSHINHSCSPTIAVRRTAPGNTSRITVFSRRSLVTGEEITASYVDPSGDVWKRRRELKEWGFGECHCERCNEEAKHAPLHGVGQELELEDELRGFLGV